MGETTYWITAFKMPIGFYCPFLLLKKLLRTKQDLKNQLISEAFDRNKHGNAKIFPAS